MESSLSVSLSHTQFPGILQSLRLSTNQICLLSPDQREVILMTIPSVPFLVKYWQGKSFFGKFYRSTKKNALLITSGVQAFLFTPTLGMHCIAQRHFYLYNHWGTTGRNTVWHVTTVWCQGDTCCWVSGTCAAPARCHCYWAGKMQWSDHEKGMHRSIPSFFSPSSFVRPLFLCR